VLGEYDRRGWGEGGHDLDWYCTGNTDAHIGTEPVYISSRDEIVALIGEESYAELKTICDARDAVPGAANGGGTGASPSSSSTAATPETATSATCIVRP
jgi:pectin methylesterase-like acyl-CoA thioesterase